MIADRLRNANGATRNSVVTVIHLALGVEMEEVAAALTVLRRRMFTHFTMKSPHGDEVEAASQK